MKQTLKGTSNAPLILGIIGSVILLPGLFCAAMCGAAIESAAQTAGEGAGAGALVFIFSLVPIVSGFVGGAFGKSKPIASMILLLISAIFTGIAWFLAAFTNMFHLASLILFIVGAVMAKTQKMESNVQE